MGDGFNAFSAVETTFCVESVPGIQFSKKPEIQLFDETKTISAPFLDLLPHKQ